MKLVRAVGITAVLAVGLMGSLDGMAQARSASSRSANTFEADFVPMSVAEAAATGGSARITRHNPSLSASDVANLVHDETARVSATGRVMFVDPVVQPFGPLTPTAIAPQEASIPLANTFLLHSHPGSNRTIYLDFTGHTVPADTVWDDSTTANAEEVALGSRFGCALSTTGFVRCWGDNSDGQIGAGYSLPTTFTDPYPVSDLSAVSTIAAGEKSACAVRDDGTVWCWGDNSFGQLGDGTQTDRNYPVQVSGISTAIDVAVGSLHACAILSGGSVACWGAGGLGQLGNGTTPSLSMSPVPVSTIATAQSIDAGGMTTCAVLSGGEVNCWGEAVSYQLGDGQTVASSTPVTVSGIGNATSVSVSLTSTSGDGSSYTVDRTHSHACAVLSTGAVKCWGYGGHYATGSGSATTVSSITTVAGISNAVSVSADGGSTCATLADGTVKCWGSNEAHQLSPTNGDVSSPTLVKATGTPTVTTLTGVSRAYTSGTFSCVISTDAAVLCWGGDYREQLGNGGYTTSTNYPAVNGTPLVAGVYPAFTVDGSASFSDAEKRMIISAWQAVAEDYAPFNVDVTTEEPSDDAITRSSVSDTTYGTRALISAGNSSWNPDTCGCGGIAFIDVFNQYPSGTYTHPRLQPAFAFAGPETSQFPSPGKYISDIASHEVGHTLSLLHDGDSSQPTPGDREYFLGLGDGKNWAPIMGGGYYNSIVQWSKGDYAVATQTQDDLVCVVLNGCATNSGGLTPVSDEIGTSIANARTISTTPISGVIGTPTDKDWFTVTVTNGSLGVYSYAPTINTNLDTSLTLLDSRGDTILSTDAPSTMTESGNGLGTWPITGMDGVMNVTLPNGKYFIVLDGVGRTGGYSEYGSLGQYSIKTRAPVTIGIPTRHNPTISGTLRKGKTLTVNYGTWSPRVTFTQRWLRDGVAISGATGKTYTLKTADVGHKISVRIVGTKTNYSNAVGYSAQTARITN